jgi:hypothetical protein
LAEKQKVKQRKRRETKNKFEWENEGIQRKRRETKKRNFGGKTEGITGEETRDKEKEILTGKQKVLKKMG